MRAARLQALAVVSVVAVGAVIAAPACGPACVDDRCSLKPASGHVDRIDGTATSHPTTTGTIVSSGGSAGSGQGSAVATGSAAGSAVAQGSAAGSAGAQGSAAGSAVPQGSAAAAKPEWMVFDNLADNSRVLIVTKDEAPAGTLVKFEFTKLPDKTPFAVYLEIKQQGSAGQVDAKWNDCGPDKLRCDVVGAKSYLTKRAGRISLQVKTNWAITGFVGDASAYLVTWTNNLTREALTIRLSR